MRHGSGMGSHAVAAAIVGSVRERMLYQVSAAAAVFEQRWTLASLYRVASELHEALLDQQEMFHAALVTGSDAEIIRHAEAMGRGWAAAIVAMQQEGAAPDAARGEDAGAVLIGEFGQTRVAIGAMQTAPAWVRERWGDKVTWLTAREVAVMYARMGLARALKEEWPDGELVEMREK